MPERRVDWAGSPAGRCFPSLADVLAEARRHICTTAIGETAYARLAECARTLPAGAASHEFWLELRPREPERADLIFALVPGWPLMPSMVFLCQASASAAMRAFGRFLQRAAVETLRDTPDWMCLEWDVLADETRVAVFAGSPRTSGFPDGAAAARALALVTGMEDAAAFRDWRHGAGTVAGFVDAVRGVGSFPERAGAPLRVWSQVGANGGASRALGRLGWNGDLDAVDAFEAAYPFGDKAFLDTDFNGRQLGPVAGIERGRPGGWTEMNPGLWAERLRWAAAEGWCDRDQADAWVSLIGSRVVETEAGPTTLNLGINHVKFVYGDGDPFMKIYVGGNMGQIRTAA